MGGPARRLPDRRAGWTGRAAGDTALRMQPAVQREARARLLYAWALLVRFRRTLLLALVVLLGSTALLWAFYEHEGKRLTFPHALDAVYFMLLANPTIEFPSERPWIGALFFLLPPLGFVVFADGVARLFLLMLAREQQSKEWISVLASTMKGHVVLCGLGHVGYRVLGQLRALGIPHVVIEQAEQGNFLKLARNEGTPVIHDDARSVEVLKAANIEQAQAVVCCTNDDLANLDVALDARRLNPTIRVVLRMFDDNLARKIEGAFGIQVAFSTSALSAPAFAMAALDPSILHGFYVGERLYVVARLVIGAELAGTTLEQLHDRRAISVLELERGGRVQAGLALGTALAEADQVVIQAPLDRFKEIRERCRPAPRPRVAA